jgi:hypothetical protein
MPTRPATEQVSAGRRWERNDYEKKIFIHYGIFGLYHCIDCMGGSNVANEMSGM